MAYFSPDGDMALQTMSSIIEQGNPNATWFPDPASLHSLPWADGDSSCVAEVFGVPYQKTNGILQPMAIASRAAALKQIRRLNDRGWIIKTGAEMEFRLLGVGNIPIVSVGDYAGQLTFAEVEEVYFYFQKNLLEAGVHIETMHTEADPGQFEFTLRPEPGIKTADGVIIFKHALKEMASKRGWGHPSSEKVVPTKLVMAWTSPFLCGTKRPRKTYSLMDVSPIICRQYVTTGSLGLFVMQTPWWHCVCLQWTATAVSINSSRRTILTGE